MSPKEVREILASAGLSLIARPKRHNQSVERDRSDDSEAADHASQPSTEPAPTSQAAD
jgi:hypothetical protein